MTNNTPLVDLINQRMAGDLCSLPVFHSVAARLHQMLVKRNFQIDEIIDLISEDQALASHVLKLANSSFYSGLSKIGTIKDAVVRLGTQEIANLAMLASQSEFYLSKNSILDSIMHRLWDHALSCAIGARWLAIKTGYRSLAPEAFIGGLLHDIGKLAIVKALDELLEDSTANIAVSETLINEILKSMHEEVGYRLLVSWRLPETYSSIAVNHHKTDFDGNDILLLLVRLSNLACRKAGRSMSPDVTPPLITAPEASFLGVKEIALAELEIVIEDAGEEKMDLSR